MSGIDWNGILRLPEAALAGCRRIPKTVLVKQAMLTKTEQKRLDKVARLEHFATVQKSTTRIPPYEDDERNVQSVVFLRCEMTAGTMAVAEVAELVHKCFPNPTVLLVEAGGCACISVALTRRSQAEQGATVVMVSHDVEFCAQYADRCGLLFRGEVVTENDPRAFFSGNYFYTTAAARIARTAAPGAVLCEEVVQCLAD